MKGDVGEVIWLLVPSGDMLLLINKYGNYAHGSVSCNGMISIDTIRNNNYEYCLRPNYRAKESSKRFQLWKALLQYESSIESIRRTLTSSG